MEPSEVEQQHLASGGFGRLKPPPRGLAPIRPLRHLHGLSDAKQVTLREAFREATEDASERPTHPPPSHGGPQTLQESLHTLTAIVSGLPQLPHLTVQALEKVNLSNPEGRAWVCNIIRLYEARVSTLERELVDLSRHCARVATLQQTLAVEKAQGDQLRSVFRALLPLQVMTQGAQEKARSAADPKELVRLSKDLEIERSRMADMVQKMGRAELALQVAVEERDDSAKKLKAVLQKVGPMSRDNDSLREKLRHAEAEVSAIKTKSAEDMATERAQHEADVAEMQDIIHRLQEREDRISKKLEGAETRCAEAEADMATAVETARQLERNRDEDMVTIAEFREQLEGMRDEGNIMSKTLSTYLDSLIVHCKAPDSLGGDNLATTVSRAIDEVILSLTEAKGELETARSTARMLKDLVTMHRQEVEELLQERDALKADLCGIQAALDTATREASRAGAAGQDGGHVPPRAAPLTDRASSPCFGDGVQREGVAVQRGNAGGGVSQRPAAAAFAGVAVAKRKLARPAAERQAERDLPAVNKKFASFLDRMKKGEAERESKWADRRDRIKQTRAVDAAKALDSFGHVAQKASGADTPVGESENVTTGATSQPDRTDEAQAPPPPEGGSAGPPNERGSVGVEGEGGGGGGGGGGVSKRVVQRQKAVNDAAVSRLAQAKRKVPGRGVTLEEAVAAAAAQPVTTREGAPIPMAFSSTKGSSLPPGAAQDTGARFRTVIDKAQTSRNV